MKNREKKQKTNNKMIEVNPNISIITFSVNDLNTK